MKCPGLNFTHATLVQRGNNYGDIVKFMCDEGYHYNNEIKGVLTCEANSQWNGDTKGCQRV